MDERLCACNRSMHVNYDNICYFLLTKSLFIVYILRVLVFDIAWGCVVRLCVFIFILIAMKLIFYNICQHFPFPSCLSTAHSNSIDNL